jgi:type IX secretion system PorP/SprF family membrane protein
MIRLVRLLVIISCCFAIQVNAQDIQFSQFYAVPVYQNPAFAGSTFMHRATVHQRLQWMNIDAKYTSTLIGFDTYLDKIGSGIGVIATHDIQSSDKIVTDDISGQYAYEIPLSEKYVIRAGAQLGIVSKAIDYSQFRYAQDYTNQGFQGNTYNQNGSNTILYGTIGSGIVLFSDKFWGGIAAHNMNQPKQTFYSNANNRLPMKMSFTGGFKHVFHRSSEKITSVERIKEINLTPTFQYKFQGKSDQLDLGLYSQLDRILVGAWYRGIAFKQYDGIQNNESLIVLGGIKYHNVSFTYSYDITVSRLSRSRTGGSHELNLTFYFQRKTSNSKMKRLPCPEFSG